jgi:mRNA-degrading endonuclease toxin of MazEF toxin-antitoxin module
MARMGQPRHSRKQCLATQLDTRRFIRKLGTLPDSDMQEITKAIVTIIEYQEIADR